MQCRLNHPPACQCLCTAFPAAAAGLAVFLNSLGDLTAYDSAGGLEWQHSVGATWRADVDDEDTPDVVPTLKAMPLRPGAVPTVILAGGAG